MRAVTTKDSKWLREYPMWLDVTVERHEVQVNEEYNVYDFTGILGSVGGSLAQVDSRLFFVATKSDSAKLTGMKNPSI